MKHLPSLAPLFSPAVKGVSSDLEVEGMESVAERKGMAAAISTVADVHNLDTPSHMIAEKEA